MFSEPLDSAPGTEYAYSNFGYCLLARCIEARDPKSRGYEKIVKQDILLPMGIDDMEIAYDSVDLASQDEATYWTTARKG